LFLPDILVADAVISVDVVVAVVTDAVSVVAVIVGAQGAYSQNFLRQIYKIFVALRCF